MDNSLHSTRAVNVTQIDLLAMPKTVAEQIHVVMEFLDDPYVSDSNWQQLQPLGVVSARAVGHTGLGKLVLALNRGQLVFLIEGHLSGSFIREFGVNDLPQIFIV